MADLVLVITEVTEMRGSYCVAGWSPIAKRMVRPLPGGEYWSLQQLQLPKSGTFIRPGLKVQFSAADASPTGDFPHRTENMIVDGKIKGIVEDPSFSWFGDRAPAVDASIEDAFQGFLRVHSSSTGINKGAFVPAGSRSRSLIALEAEAESLSLFVDEKSRLRGRLADPKGTYNLAVVSKSIRETWRLQGIDVVRSQLPTNGKLHIRIGLARPFDNQPDKCYLMINGVYW